MAGQDPGGVQQIQVQPLHATAAPTYYGASPMPMGQGLPGPGFQSDQPLPAGSMGVPMQALPLHPPPLPVFQGVSDKDYPEAQLSPPPNAVPPGAVSWQLEIPDTDGRAYGRNWCWLGADSVGIGCLLYNTPSIFQKAWYAVLGIFQMLGLYKAAIPDGKIDFESWSSVHTQNVQSIFLSRVDFISAHYVVSKSAELKQHIPMLRPESHVAGFIAGVRTMFADALEWWMKIILRVLEIMFQNELGYIATLILLCALGLIMCFVATGSDGKPEAMSAALAFAVIALVMSLCGLVWSIHELRTENNTQYHQSVARRPLRHLRNTWIALCVILFVAMLTCAIFVGDWQKNGPSSAESSDDGCTAEGDGKTYCPWTTGEKFICKNYDSSSKGLKPSRSFDTPDSSGGGSDDSASVPRNMCHPTERGSVTVSLLMFLGALICAFLLLWWTLGPRNEREYLYAQVTFFGPSRFGLPVTVLLEAPQAQEVQMAFLQHNAGRYQKETAYIYAPTLSDARAKQD